MNSELEQRVAAFLATYHVMSLATVGLRGPDSTNLFYACDGLALVWVSDPDTRHSRDIAANPRVAATVAPDYSDFADIRGIQIAGAAQPIVAMHERKRHLALLEARYPFLGELARGPTKLLESYRATTLYRFRPARIIL